MYKRFFVSFLCFLFVTNGTNARFPDRPDADSYIVVLKEPSLSRSMVDIRDGSIYKGIAARRHRNSDRAGRRRIMMDKRLKLFEDRLKGISPRIVPRRRFTGLLNGVSVDMPKGMASRIRSLPEVMSIVPNRRYQKSLTKSNDLMNVPLAWQFIGGREIAGQGIKIGIIDTGIDHTHVMFDDEGYELPEGYPLGDTDFTSKKVIVARVFTKNGDDPADLTPRDRNGHGTHVASCAAGNLDTLSPLGLISGLAPRAQLGNYKVFTGEFTTLEQIIAALEACVEDGMDVVNLSLGSESYINTVLDPEAIAIRNAIEAGVVVVAAAGNSGAQGTIGSPGQIPQVITVGALTNSHDGTSSGAHDIAMMNVYSNGERIISDEQVILGPDPEFFLRPLLGRFQIVDADTLDGGRYGGDLTGTVCQSLPDGSAQDKWVLTQRGTCLFTEKINSVQQAGGWGALIYNNNDANESPDEPLRYPSVGGTQVPSYFISRNIGLAIKDALAGADMVEVEFYAAPPNEWNATPFQISTFSSVGPSLDYVIKPEITAIGQGSYAATQNDWPGEFESDFFEYTSFDLSGFSFSSGTSFSSPRVAGVAALIKQANPSWKPREVKSAIVTSAERLPGLASMSAMERGGGHVNTTEAMNPPLIVLPATVSWENVLIDDTTEVTKSIRLKNTSAKFQNVSLSLEFSGNRYVVATEVFPDKINLAPADSIDVSLKITVLPPSDELGSFDDISGDVVVELIDEYVGHVLQVPVWIRVTNAPPVSGNILLIDDDSGESIENQYIESINRVGHQVTLWDVAKLQTYPSVEYMQKFDVVSWFLGTTSLFNIRGNNTLSTNERIRFNVTLTRYLARAGRLLVSGMDWSDGQEQTLFGQQVLHISEFRHDPFVVYTPDGEVASQEDMLEIFGVFDSPIGQSVAGLHAGFDSDVPNMSDLLVLDNTGIAKPALISSRATGEVIGITAETGSYRAVFYSFPLERVLQNPRLSREGIDIILQSSLDWLMNGSRKLLSIQSVEPAAQIDNSADMPATLTVEGINFSVGHDVWLNETPVEVTAVDITGRVEIIIPAELPEGLYDITLNSPDDQTSTLPGAFTIY